MERETAGIHRPLNRDYTDLSPEQPIASLAMDDLHRISVTNATHAAHSLPDINVYLKKKIFAQGMMDLALLSANANQLRYVLDAGSSHSYFYFSLTCISISIFLQITVGILLLWNSTYNIHKERDIILANRINNFTIMGIFLITFLNVFITAFGLLDKPLGVPQG